MSDLPNLELLIKLLKMTTSSNDAEALLFMRKANEQLLKTGWDWDKLLRGQVKVIVNPFNSVPMPQHEPKEYRQTPAAEPRPTWSGNPPPPPRPQPPPRPAWSPPRKPSPPKRGRKIHVTLSDLGL